MLRALVERLAQEPVEQAHHAGDRIVGEMRIGHVALLALDDDPTR